MQEDVLPDEPKNLAVDFTLAVPEVATPGENKGMLGERTTVFL